MLYERKYGQTTAAKALITFPLFDPTGATLVTGVSFATGDITVSKDEAAFGNATNLPVEEGNGFYSWTPTSTELSCRRLSVVIDDVTATDVWLPTAHVIETFGGASPQVGFDYDLGTPTVNVTSINGIQIANTYAHTVQRIESWVVDAGSWTPDEFDATYQEGGGSPPGGYDDKYVGRHIMWVIGGNAGSASLIRGFTDATDTFVITPLENTPVATDEFIII